MNQRYQNQDSNTNSFCKHNLDQDYTKMVVARGEPFTYPKDKLIVYCDNGLEDNAGVGDYGLGGITRYSQLKKRSVNMTFYLMKKDTFCKHYMNLVGNLSDTSATTSTTDTSVSKFFHAFNRILCRNLLFPSSWYKLQNRKLSVFGSMFSHQSVDHISSNLGAVYILREAETWLGTATFSHLYLISGLTSTFFSFYWQNRHNQGIKREKAWEHQVQ